MTHGPCAGVRSDGGREVTGSTRCGYLEVGAEDLPYPAVLPRLRPRTHGGRAAKFVATAAARSVVVIDVVAPALSAAGLRETAAELAGVADACLLGDQDSACVQLPPAYRAQLLAEEGARAWVGIHSRDRNRVPIEGGVAASVDAGAVGIHSLAHAPAGRPTERRPRRLLTKVDVVFVDHCDGPALVIQNVSALRATGFAGLVLACVPRITSGRTAAVVRSIAGDRSPAGYPGRILGARVVRLRGMASAMELAAAMWKIPGSDGENLSGGARPGAEVVAARDLAEAGRRVLGMAAGVAR